VAYATVFALAWALVELAVAHHQANRRFLTAGRLRVVRASVLLVASVVISLTSGSALLISVCFIAAIALAGFICAGPTLRASVERGARRSSSHSSSHRLDAEELWLTFYYLAAASFAYVDVIVAGALLEDHEIATLGASLRYLAIILAAAPALGAVLRVRTSQVDIVDSAANQRRMLVGWTRHAVLPAVGLVAGAALLAPVVIPLIDGGRYPDSIPTFQIFLVTAFSAYMSAPSTNILMAQKRYAALASIYGVGFLVNAIGDVLVAREFGVVGIATVSATTYVVIDIAMVLQGLRGAPADRRSTCE
jgi:O-antigen/teichoic acid export membrane protein